MNLFTDNADLQFHFQQGVPWDRFVPLWEEGFALPDGPRSLAEARELYQDSLAEVGEFAAREIEPRARGIDQEGVDFKDGRVVLPPALIENIEGLKRLGVMAVNLPREAGGFNFPLTVGTALTEILSRACTNTLLLHSFYQGPAIMILRFGSREQIERWVKPLASGEISGAVAMTEPDAGSDVGALSTRAEADGNGFRLTGSKQFITNGCGD
ncbi:MAG TPA: acyl-CoA dehydrogenase family protein, partial [Vicinamibacteria bacterium]|nr:acyl-CoA dehydrogenase family protein [Vicinamibacteria bacterium]